jgi:hypothetical protein
MSRLAAALLLAAWSATTRADAQAPLHLAARAATSTSSAWGDPRGAGLSVDVTTSPRIDLRFGYLVGRGEGEGIFACPARASSNCITRRVPRTQTVHLGFAAMPTRLGMTGPVEWRFVPALHLGQAIRRYGDDPLDERRAPDRRRSWGTEIGLEMRWYATADGRLQVVANAESGTVSGVAEAFTEDLSEPNTVYGRLTLGVRYRLRPR